VTLGTDLFENNTTGTIPEKRMTNGISKHNP